MRRYNHLLLTTLCLALETTWSFQSHASSSRRKHLSFHRRTFSTTALKDGIYYNDFEDYGSNNSDNSNNNNGNNEEEEYIDTDGLGDWRAFRLNLAESGVASASTTRTKTVPKSISKENEEILRSQSQELADEFSTGVWAHETFTPEVGGLLVRMPVEVELFRNHKHSTMGKELRAKLGSNPDRATMRKVYHTAQQMVDNMMETIASQAKDGQIDATDLDETSQEMLALYLENQSTWQEVCLVLNHSEEEGTATTVVLNRPMAFKLTENLAQLVLRGAYTTDDSRGVGRPSLDRFLQAFGKECAVYVGGTDCQEEAALLVHGFADLPGAREISPGANIYVGGLTAAVEGVLSGRYQALDFRFFVGRHEYTDKLLDLEVVLGKLQPIAAARTLALKQCISLPKPLFHEVLDLCGGEMEQISLMEMLKRDDIQILQDDDIFEFSDEVIDELDELDDLDEDDDDDEDFD